MTTFYEFFKEAKNFALNFYNLSRYLDIQVVYKNLPKYHATVYQISDKYDNSFSYYVEINKNQNIYNMVISLFHEMTHIHQYESGKLINMYEKTIWNRKIFKESDYTYEELPWEIEAFQQENVLYKKFVNECSRESIDFLLKNHNRKVKEFV